MDSYRENRWWLSHIPEDRAYYQTEVLVKSGILLLSNLGDYQADLFTLLHCPVLSAEMIEPSVRKLWQEVQTAARRDCTRSLPGLSIR
jgi:hypothetical protein